MKIQFPDGSFSSEIDLPISKSIANRYLIISSLSGKTLELLGSVPEDVAILRSALQSKSNIIDVGMAGTAMRFLAAYFAVQDGKTTVITGSERMKSRPISQLVDALKTLGADIQYLENEGFPPIKIAGKKLNGDAVEIDANVSSQFISALMMISPSMHNGLTIKLTSKVLSRPYLELTADCMRNAGVKVEMSKDHIFIIPQKYQEIDNEIESDWSAASYFYALAAARPNSEFLLKGLELNSLQGDAILAKWFHEIGVSSRQTEKGVEIKSGTQVQLPNELDFSSNPDLAQTFAFLAVTLDQPLKLTGLDNLRLKETDRISALQLELEKLGSKVIVEETSLPVSGSFSVKQANVETYNDHRMAMSAAVLGTQLAVEIQNPGVVVKSFPKFWEMLPR